jgi:hypothetical protein
VQFLSRSNYTLPAKITVTLDNFIAFHCDTERLSYPNALNDPREKEKPSRILAHVAGVSFLFLRTRTNEAFGGKTSNGRQTD